jgi:hypothetical protein
VKTLLLLILSLIFPVTLRAQNYIGLTRDSLIQVFCHDFPELTHININRTYNLLNLSEPNGFETCLAFFDSTDRCYLLKFFFDPAVDPFVWKHLQTHYQSVTATTWVTLMNGILVDITYRWTRSQIIVVTYRQRPLTILP